MTVRKAGAKWIGSFREGRGRMRTESGEIQGDFSCQTRFGDEGGANPEELIGAAHAGCYSMALAATLEESGFRPKMVETAANVKVEERDGGYAITQIQLDTKADVPDLDLRQLKEQAEKAAKRCMIGKALAGTQIIIQAALKEGAGS